MTVGTTQSTLTPQAPTRASDGALDLPESLARRLAADRPRRDPRSSFAPELSYGRHRMPPLPDTRAASVLVLIYPGAQGWTLPLTLRPRTLSVHAGQISLPGGYVHVGETPEQTARRECRGGTGLLGGRIRSPGPAFPRVYLWQQLLRHAVRCRLSPTPAVLSQFGGGRTNSGVAALRTGQSGASWQPLDLPAGRPVSGSEHSLARRTNLGRHPADSGRAVGPARRTVLLTVRLR